MIKPCGLRHGSVLLTAKYNGGTCTPCLVWGTNIPRDFGPPNIPRKAANPGNLVRALKSSSIALFVACIIIYYCTDEVYKDDSPDPPNGMAAVRAPRK